MTRAPTVDTKRFPRKGQPQLSTTSMNTNRLLPSASGDEVRRGGGLSRARSSREHEGAGLVSLRPENTSTSRPGRAYKQRPPAAAPAHDHVVRHAGGC